jgi:phage terminase large subunit-like protein
MRDLKYHYKKYNLSLDAEDDKVRILKFDLVFPNDTFIRVLAQSYTTAAGSRHAVTLWDELWGVNLEERKRMWDEMTPIPTVNNSLRIVTTYAGFVNESDLLWELYLRGVGKEEHDDGQGELIPEMVGLPCWKSGGQFTLWSHDPIMPWHTDSFLEKELMENRPAMYLRLWENRWVTTHEEFIPIEWWDTSIKMERPADGWIDHPYHAYPVSIGVDAGVKRDCTAIVGVTYDSKRGKVIQLFHQIWTPKSNDPIDLDETAMKYLIDHSKQYKIVSICCDPSQLLQIMTNMRKLGLPVREFTQNSSIMIDASQALYDTLRYKNFETYKEDEMRSHIQNAIAKVDGRGFRIVRDKSNRSARRPMDAAVALAMATYDAIQRMKVNMDVPIIIESPFSDMAEWKDRNPKDDFGWQFRSVSYDG